MAPNPKPTVAGDVGHTPAGRRLTPGGGVELGPESDGAKAPDGAGSATTQGLYGFNPGVGNGAPVVGGNPAKGPQTFPKPTGKVSTPSGRGNGRF